MTLIKTLQKLLEKIESWTLVFLLSVIILLSFLQVILRQFFLGGFIWGDIFLRHLVLWVGFLGAMLAAGQNKHFVIDILKDRLPERLKACAEILANLFALACLFLLSNAAIKFFKDELDYGSDLFSLGTLDVPGAWLNVIIPAGFIMLFVHFLLNAIGQIISFFARSSGSSGER